MLNMEGYFTSLRVDRHEITFRVEDNPEKKTASDIARNINEKIISDQRSRNNLSRRLGVTMIKAGVGDKIKTYDLDEAQRVDLRENTNSTDIIEFMLAGAGAAAVVVIIIIIFLLKGYDRTKDKLGDLQHNLSGSAETCKDYQELCRARMTSKGSSSDTPASAGRVVILNQENERPPSSRSSTSSWSEEPALSNMDISTGHMVLVSVFLETISKHANERQ